MESEQADSHKMDFNATEEEEFGFSRNYFLAKEMGSSGKKSARKLSDINVVDEQALRLRSNELKLERQLENTEAEISSFKKKMSSLEKERQDFLSTIEALKEG